MHSDTSVQGMEVTQQDVSKHLSGRNWGFPGDSDNKESACNVGALCSIPGSEKSPGEGNGYQLPYFCLENFMNRRAWQAPVQGVAKSRR